MNTRQLQYVLAVAEERSFTKAANKLLIAQPSLSQYISKLEQDLGHELFDRSETPLVPTAAGQIYVEAARRILDLEIQTEKRLRNMNDEQYGRLVIGTVAHRGQCILPAASKQFFDKYPNYEVIIHELMNKPIVKLMDNDELDICITTLPIDVCKYGYVNVRKEEGLLLAIPEKFPINNTLSKVHDDSGSPYPSIDLSELRGEPFVLTEETSLTYKLAYDLCWHAGFRPKVVLRCATSELCRRIATKGVGITILPAIVLEYTDNSKGLILYRLNYEYEKQTTVAIYRKNSRLSNAAKYFLDIMGSATPSDPPLA